MVETCPSCYRQFANQRSLATHKSRFHNEFKDSTPSKKKHLTGMVEKPGETSDTDSELSYGRESTLNTTAVPTDKSDHPMLKDPINEHDIEDNMEIESKASGVGSSSSDDEIQTDDSISNSDVASDISSNISSSAKFVSEESKHKLQCNKRKANDDSKVISLLTSIEYALKSQSCKEEGLKCFDFLFCYTMKKHFFAELDSWFSTELGKNMEDLLTQEEQYFVDAVISTSNLFNLHRLMNENSAMVKSILEQYTAEKKEKQQKRG